VAAFALSQLTAVREDVVADRGNASLPLAAIA
jgi:hypothetical protein